MNENDPTTNSNSGNTKTGRASEEEARELAHAWYGAQAEKNNGLDFGELNSDLADTVVGSYLTDSQINMGLAWRAKQLAEQAGKLPDLSTPVAVKVMSYCDASDAARLLVRFPDAVPPEGKLANATEIRQLAQNFPEQARFAAQFETQDGRSLIGVIGSLSPDATGERCLENIMRSVGVLTNPDASPAERAVANAALRINPDSPDGIASASAGSGNGYKSSDNKLYGEMGRSAGSDEALSLSDLPPVAQEKVLSGVLNDAFEKSNPDEAAKVNLSLANVERMREGKIVNAGDLLHTTGLEHLSEILHSGVVCGELLGGEQAIADAYPFNVDFNQALDGDVLHESFEDKMVAASATRHQKGGTGLTLIFGRETAQKYAARSANTDRHRLILGAVSSSEIASIVLENDDPQSVDADSVVRDVIAHGVYIPVWSASGELILTPEEFESQKDILSLPDGDPKAVEPIEEKRILAPIPQIDSYGDDDYF